MSERRGGGGGAGVGQRPLLCPARSDGLDSGEVESHDGQRGTVRGTPIARPSSEHSCPSTDDWASAQAGMGLPWHDLPPAWFCFSSEP